MFNRIILCCLSLQWLFLLPACSTETNTTNPVQGGSSGSGNVSTSQSSSLLKIMPGYPAFGADTSQCPLPVDAGQAGTVYLCDCQTGADAACVPGDDANPGTASAPQKSLGSALAAMGNGQSVAFCRGGAWNTSQELMPNASNCSTSSPCNLEDYGDATLAKPLIMQTDGNTNLFTIDPGMGATWQGINFKNLHLTNQTLTSGNVGIFIYKDVRHISMECLEVDNFSGGVYLNPNDILTAGYITLKNSYIHDNGTIGVLGAMSNMLIEHNRINNNGFQNASVFNHNMYLFGSGLSVDKNSVVRGNWLSNSAVDAATGQCVGVSFTVHNDVTVDLLIENNLIEESNASNGCYGLTVDAAGTTTESHTRAIIRGNVLNNTGNISIGISSCIDCVIENNVVVQTRYSGTAIAAPIGPTSAPDADNTGAIVRNNTLYFDGSGGGDGIYVGERGNNHSVTNNIVYFASSTASDACFNFDLPASDYSLVSNNLCYGAAFYNPTGTINLDGMASTSDPQFFTNETDLRINPSSPASNSGTTVSASTVDILGVTRDSAPDRGAYEAQ